MGNKQITNLGYSISDPTDVINLGFGDQKYLQKVSDSDLDMDDHRIKNSLEPVNGRDLTTKNYVDTEIEKNTKCRYITIFKNRRFEKNDW